MSTSGPISSSAVDTDTYGSGSMKLTLRLRNPFLFLRLVHFVIQNLTQQPSSLFAVVACHDLLAEPSSQIADGYALFDFK